MTPEEEIQNAFATTPPEALEMQRLLMLVDKCKANGFVNIASKIREYKGKYIGDLIAELRLALAVARDSARVRFQVEHFPDLHVQRRGAEFEIEVEHKSSASASNEMFYGDPAMLPAYATSGQPHLVQAHRLHQLLAAEPVTITVVVGAEFEQPQWSRHERRKVEDAWADVTRWLIEQFPVVATSRPTELAGPRGTKVFFEWGGAPPGRIVRVAGEAYSVRSFWPDETGDSTIASWLRGAIRKKAEKFGFEDAKRRGFYLVGLVIDEAFACQGHDLTTALFGAAVADMTRKPTRHYRPVPEGKTNWIERARSNGFEGVVAAAKLDARERPRFDGEAGLYFDDICRNVQGVLALYYTDSLQYLPNPFAEKSFHAPFSEWTELHES